MKIEMNVFEQLPIHDTCWSIISGADNHIYAAACCEYVGGSGVFLVRYNTDAHKIEYLLDVAETIEQPPDNGRATQCKLHYSLLSGLDGTIYGATHLSAPGKGQRFFNPWMQWKDEKHGFPGSMFFAYDPVHDKVLFTDCIAPNEGCRCLAIDQERQILYGVTYPRNHFFYYELETRRRVDVGRIGNVNPQAIFLDDRNRAYTNDDYGWMMRFDIDRGDFEDLDVRVPHAPYQDGLHTILYDVVKIPGEDAVIGVPWNTDPRFFKYTFDDGPGRMEDLGAPAVEHDGVRVSRVQADHVGGLVFGRDDLLYYCANVPTELKKGVRRRIDNITYLMSMDIRTGERERLDQLKFGDFEAWYVSRAVRDREGNLYLADVGNTPCRMYKVIPDYPDEVREKREPEDINMRHWG